PMQKSPRPFDDRGRMLWSRLLACLWLTLVLIPRQAFAQKPATATSSQPAIVVELEGKAEFLPRGTQNDWRELVTNFSLQPGDRVRVHERSRLTLRLANQSTARFAEGAEFAIESRPDPKAKAGISLFK